MTDIAQRELDRLVRLAVAAAIGSANGRHCLRADSSSSRRSFSRAIERDDQKRAIKASSDRLPVENPY
jgi:hypothetical protein